MAPSRKRLSSSIAVPETTLDQTTNLLGQGPEKTKDTLTLREAIAQLEATVTVALAKGYDYDELADLLTRDGIEISTASLKYHLAALKRKQGGDRLTKRRGGRQASGQNRSITLIRSPGVALAAKQEVEDVIAYLLEESPAQSNRSSATASDTKATPQGKNTLRKRK
jgi:hypothetical protein